ncbi:hypothetical protein T492DRAFT_552035 [Pavlovales sp. CCMP2436]|nr:hypothetical protein T492DRAFT_552035 [Pavlovales sp. CCMP2436]
MVQVFICTCQTRRQACRLHHAQSLKYEITAKFARPTAERAVATDEVPASVKMVSPHLAWQKPGACAITNAAALSFERTYQQPQSEAFSKIFGAARHFNGRHLDCSPQARARAWTVPPTAESIGPIDCGLPAVANGSCSQLTGRAASFRNSTAAGKSATDVAGAGGRGVGGGLHEQGGKGEERRGAHEPAAGGVDLKCGACEGAAREAEKLDLGLESYSLKARRAKAYAFISIMKKYKKKSLKARRAKT